MCSNLAELNCDQDCDYDHYDVILKLIFLNPVGYKHIGIRPLTHERHRETCGIPMKSSSCARTVSYSSKGFALAQLKSFSPPTVSIRRMSE